eukprot:g864.t1
MSLSPSEALARLRGSSFDADATKTMKVLLKIVDNILADPMNPKKRKLRLKNRLIQTRVVARPGAQDFLASIGFISSSESSTDDPVIELLGEKRSILLRGREALSRASIDLDFKIPSPPQPLTSTETEEKHLLENAFKSHIRRVVPQPRGPMKSDVALRRLQQRERQLIAEREKSVVERVGPGKRDSQILRLGAKDVVATSPDPARAENAGKSVSDRRLLRDLAKRRHDEIEKRKKFTTRSMRELEAQRRKRVCLEILLRIELPCKSVVQARFRTSETVEAVVAAVRSWLVLSARKFDFKLFTSVPRLVITDPKYRSRELGSLKLGQASRLYMAWTANVQPPTSSRPHWLCDEILKSIAEPRNAEAAFPTAAFVDPESRRRGSESSGSSASKTQGKRPTRRKPAWLKL